MPRCFVFCAGELDTPAILPLPGDFVIAADGGLRHTQRLGITPDLILGDFDSLGYTPPGALVFPVEKDDTDAMLAVREGLSRSFREFFLYGCLGGPRPDHTLASLQTLLFLAEHGAAGYALGSGQTVTALQRECLHFPAAASGLLSVFAVGKAEDVTIQGAQYEISNATLHAGFPLGVSNHFTGKAVSVSADGSLLVFWDTGSLPERRKLQ